MKIATICFLLKENQICLGMKKVGFGAGKWNGFGGKVGDKVEFRGETVEESVIREGREEFGVEVKSLEKAAELIFGFPHNRDWDHHVHVFLCRKWEGEPQESNEMQPKWFRISELPYNQMWEDDQYWLPLVLEGKKLSGSFDFGMEGGVIRQLVEVLGRDVWLGKERLPVY